MTEFFDEREIKTNISETLQSLWISGLWEKKVGIDEELRHREMEGTGRPKKKRMDRRTAKREWVSNGCKKKKKIHIKTLQKLQFSQYLQHQKKKEPNNQTRIYTHLTYH